jgi:hypothetical protein
MYSNKFIAKIGKRFVVTKQLNVELGIVLVASGIMDGVLVILDAGLGMIDGALGIIIAGCRRRVVFHVNPDDISHNPEGTSHNAEKASTNFIIHNSSFIIYNL